MLIHTNIIPAIPAYGVAGITGVLSGFIVLFFLCKKKEYSYDDAIYAYTWSCISAIIGAKVLYFIQNINPILSYLKNDPDNMYEKIKNVMVGGFVFYGGLFGAIIGVSLASRFFSFSLTDQLSVLTPILPLVHGFGRLGCHLTGCCYGKEFISPFSVCYADSLYAPNHVALFPIQITESIFDFGLFILLYMQSIKGQPGRKLLDIYMVSYSIFRFVAEFARGDTYRGYLFSLSFSQWISLLILFFELIRFIRRLYGDNSEMEKFNRL